MDRLGIQSLNAGAPDLRLSGDQTQRGTYTQRRRDQMAYGGIAGLDGRKRYGLGSWFQEQKDKAEAYFTGKTPTQIDNESQLRVDREQSINRPLPPGFDITKDRVADITPIGDPQGTGPHTPWYEQALKGELPSTGNQQLDQLIGTTGNQLGLGQYFPMFGQKPQIGQLPPGLNFLNLPTNLEPYIERIVKEKAAVPGQPIYGTDPGGTANPGAAGGPEIRGYSPEQPAEYTKEYQVNPLYPIGGGLAAGLYTMMQPRDTLPMDQTGIDFSKFQTAEAAAADPSLRFKPIESARAAQGGRIGYEGGESVINYNEDPEYRGWKKMYEMNPDVASMHDNHNTYLNFYNAQGQAQGGRIGAQEGGLMDLGGMEKDYRQEGGFVPIGGREKADDVPARLSKNEFVFTADAVRAAGGGDIDAGAEVMENLMENLEAGGKVSEDSQGLEGAREMFANTQRLQNRII